MEGSLERKFQRFSEKSDKQNADAVRLYKDQRSCQVKLIPEENLCRGMFKIDWKVK